MLSCTIFCTVLCYSKVLFLIQRKKKKNEGKKRRKKSGTPRKEAKNASPSSRVVSYVTNRNNKDRCDPIGTDMEESNGKIRIG